MRPVSSFEGTIESTMDGQKIAMGIDEDAVDIIIDMVTELYSDREMAVVREYATNARDSHIEAGNDAPIEVITPTELSPYLIIRDFGIGMSLSDIEVTYSKYGASRKRHSDDFNGMLGVGSKSALAYTEQFTVSAVKDGFKTLVIVTRDANLRPVMEVVDTRMTDEPNGVEVKIPAKYGSHLEQKAKDFFRFWNPDTVLLNGESPDTIFDQDYNQITDRVFSFADLQNDYIVMGNVAYRLENREMSRSYSDSWQTGTVAFVGMGEIAFPPSREAVAYTPKTKQTIADLNEEVKQALQDKIIADIAGASSHTEAFKIWRAWQHKVRQMPTNLSYKGDPFVERVSVNYITFEPRGGRYQSNGGRSGRAETNYTAYLTNLIDDKTVLVTGFTKEELSATDKKKIKAHLEGYEQQIKQVHLFDTMPGAPWTNDLESVSWDDIKSIKLNTGPRAVRGAMGSIPIEVFTKSGWMDAEEIDDTKPVLYLSGAVNNGSIYADDIVSLQLYLSVFPDVQILKLGRNRWNKLVREFPSAKEFTEAEFAKGFYVIERSLTADDIKVIQSSQYDREIAKRFKGQEIDDPMFKEILEIDSLDKTRVTRYNDYWNRVRYGVNRKYKEKDKSVLAKRYPIAEGSWQYNGIPMDHKVIYINAVYAAKYKESK